MDIIEEKIHAHRLSGRSRQTQKDRVKKETNINSYAELKKSAADHKTRNTVFDGGKPVE